jgi:hypothetical protein
MVNLGESNKVLPGDSSKSIKMKPTIASSLRWRKGPGESTHATVGESAFSQPSDEDMAETETRHGKRVYHTYFMMVRKRKRERGPFTHGMHAWERVLPCMGAQVGPPSMPTTSISLCMRAED